MGHCLVLRTVLDSMCVESMYEHMCVYVYFSTLLVYKVCAFADKKKVRTTLLRESRDIRFGLR